MEAILSPTIALSHAASNLFLPLLNTFSDAIFPDVFKIWSQAGLGKINEDHTEQDFKWVVPLLWDEAKRRHIRMWQYLPFGQYKQLFVAEYGGKRIMFERMPVPPGKGRGVWWIDDKGVLKRKLRARGLPVAKGRAVATHGAALRLFRTLQKPVIVKPHKGTGTRHTVLHITDEAELARAFEVARKVSPFVMVEEELQGAVYRPTVINSRLVATIERNQPQIRGDGRHSIEELVAQENRHPRRRGPVFGPIELTPTVKKELMRQGYTKTSVPDAGAVVFLHQKINWGNGGTTRDVTDDVHPDNAALFEEIARLTKAPILGIDFIIRDISKSWKDSPGCGVIECNSMPFVDTHHLPFEGAPRDIMGPIWEAVFPDAPNPHLPPLSHESAK
jgi:cyanophycin synthetase